MHTHKWLTDDETDIVDLSPFLAEYEGKNIHPVQQEVQQEHCSLLPAEQKDKSQAKTLQPVHVPVVRPKCTQPPAIKLPIHTSKQEVHAEAQGQNVQVQKGLVIAGNIDYKPYLSAGLFMVAGACAVKFLSR